MAEQGALVGMVKTLPKKNHPFTLRKVLMSECFRLHRPVFRSQVKNSQPGVRTQWTQHSWFGRGRGGGGSTRRDFKTYKRNRFVKKLVTFMWYSNDTFHCMFKAEFVTLVSLKVPSGTSDFFFIMMHKPANLCTCAVGIGLCRSGSSRSPDRRLPTR